MLSLKQSPAFQKEYSTWKSQINEITDNDQLKKELSSLLGELVSQVNFLDTQHQDLSVNNRLSNQSTESKDRLLEIRKTIDKKLKDYKTNQPVL